VTSMRVLWFNHRDVENPKAGGAERTIVEVGKRLRQRGHQIDLVSPNWGGGAAETEIEGIRVHRYRGSLLPHAVAPVLLKGKLAPNVIVDDLAHVIPWFSPWFTSIPTVVFFRHYHGRTLDGQLPGPFGSLFKSVERRYSSIYKDSTFITESKQAVSDLGALGIPERRCRRITPGVDSQWFRPARTVTPGPSVIYFGGLRHYKRPEDCVRAVASIGSGQSRPILKIVGEGPCLTHLRNLARELGVGDSVEFLGRLNASDLRDLLSRAWVNVHCSVAEGWCLSAMEAAACGVPTVAYDVPGVHESMANGRSGILVSDGDVGALSQGLLQILEDPAPWRPRARDYAMQFDWDSTASMWENVLQDAASKRAPN
jgi:glycosyltransferase involved in cell wall biosynthesis